MRGVAVTGVHALFYSAEADKLRETLRDVFGFEHVDIGGGWLIFALPPAEAAVHPAEAPGAELYLMCDDLRSEMSSLIARGVSCSEVEEARWGSITRIRLPGGGTLGLYQPRHPTAIDRG